MKFYSNQAKDGLKENSSMSELVKDLELNSTLSELPDCGLIVVDTVLGKDIEQKFKENISLQGVIVLHDSQLYGMISRRAFFEYLSSSFGPQLFLNRPVGVMAEQTKNKTLVVSSHERVRDISAKIYQRPIDEIYEPVVVSHEGSYRLLDIRGYFQALSYLQKLQNIELEQTQQKLEISRKKAEESNLLITQSIRYASKIQSALLPKETILSELFEDYFIIWQERDLVGGDFYWFERIGDDCLISLIDCTGHGVPGAFMALIVNSFLRFLCLNNDPSDPGSILTELNRLIKEHLHQVRKKKFSSNDGFDGSICYISLTKKKIIYAGARMDLMVFNSRGDISRLIRGARKGAGYTRTPINFKYENQYIEIRDGDRFYLATDGITDVIHPEKKIKFGFKRLRNLLKENCELSMAEQKQIILDTIRDWQKSDQFRDDLSMFGFTLSP